MNFLRLILNFYRVIQNKIFGRKTKGIMPQGIECFISGDEKVNPHSDIVHPCVRYIETGFMGHKWWMCFTPYYAANEKEENPILCWSDEETNPITWRFYAQVVPQPKQGYNSDPYILYHHECLYVYWRETDTLRVVEMGLHHATFCRIYYPNGTFADIKNPILTESFQYRDKETCPSIKILSENEVIAYGMDLTFKNEKLKTSNNFCNGIIKRVLLILSLTGIYNQQKSNGIAIFTGTKLDKKLSYNLTIKFINCNKLYRPWHMDIFEHEGITYAIVQTNQCNADICLAKSTDGIHFVFFKQPLITCSTIKKVGIYKPSAVVHNNFLYLYYTAQDIDNRSQNKLYLTTSNFKNLLNSLNQ